jgi:large subunit ribosomal protein L31
MKKKIHPLYHPKAKITCTCGQSFIVGSTMKEIHVEICSNCHPFYTGKQKLVDTARRVDRFRKRLEKTKEKKAAAKKRKKVEKKRGKRK